MKIQKVETIGDKCPSCENQLIQSTLSARGTENPHVQGLYCDKCDIYFISDNQ